MGGGGRCSFLIHEAGGQSLSGGDWEKNLLHKWINSSKVRDLILDGRVGELQEEEE